MICTNKITVLIYVLNDLNSVKVLRIRVNLKFRIYSKVLNLQIIIIKKMKAWKNRVLPNRTAYVIQY